MRKIIARVQIKAYDSTINNYSSLYVYSTLFVSLFHTHDRQTEDQRSNGKGGPQLDQVWQEDSMAWVFVSG